MIRRIRPVSRTIVIEAEIRRDSGGSRRDGRGTPGLPEPWVPAADVFETETEVRVEIEAPGVAKRDLRVLLGTNRIEVRGLKREDPPGPDGRFHRLEREFGSFERILALPTAVDPEGAYATLENGLLTVVLRKPAPRRGEVEVRIRDGDKGPLRKE
jgi:HSP20 family molecular chaperone IbpA